MSSKNPTPRGIDLHRFMRLYNIDNILTKASTGVPISDIHKELSRKGYTESARTIYEDVAVLKTLSGQSGYELEWVEHNGIQYFNVDPAKRLFRSNFTEDEIVDLQPLIELIGNIIGLEHTNNLNRLFSIVEHSSKRQRIVDLGIKAYRDTELFNRLYDAIKECRIIELHYHPFNELNMDIEPKCIDFHPYLIKHYNGRWAIIGAVASDGYICKFYLDQVVDIENTKGKKQFFDDAERSRVEHIYDHVVGIDAPRQLCVAGEASDIRPPERIILASKKNQGNSVARFTLHPSQTELEQTSNEVAQLRAEHPELSEDAQFFAIDCYLNHDLERALMARSEDIIVLSPRALRDNVAQHLSEVEALYSK